jgi:hypothetical protein
MRLLLALVFTVLVPVLRAAPFLDLPAMKNAGYLSAYDSSARWNDDEKSGDSDKGCTALSNYCGFGTAFLQHSSGGDLFCDNTDTGSHFSGFGDCWTSRSWDCPVYTPPSCGGGGGGGGTQPVPDENSVGFLLAATALGLAVLKKLLPDIRLG